MLLVSNQALEVGINEQSSEILCWTYHTPTLLDTLASNSRGQKLGEAGDSVTLLDCLRESGPFTKPATWSYSGLSWS